MDPMKKAHDENQTARKNAETAALAAHEATCDALRLARQCKVKEGEALDPMIPALASSAGREAAEARKAAKAAAAEAASHRRIACRKAMGDTPPPPLARDLFGGGMPKPPGRK